MNTNETGDEEVKYISDDSDRIIEISKKVKNGEGESVGINFLKGEHLKDFKEYLDKTEDRDYDEEAMDNAAKDNAIFFEASDLSEYKCTEVDFPEDLKAANDFLEDQETVQT